MIAEVDSPRKAKNCFIISGERIKLYQLAKKLLCRSGAGMRGKQYCLMGIRLYVAICRLMHQGNSARLEVIAKIAMKLLVLESVTLVVHSLNTSLTPGNLLETIESYP